MKRNRHIITFAALLFTFFQANAQQFGQNKIQYEHQNWNYIQSEHFDLYFYDNGDRVAEMAAAIAESSYSHLSRSFNYQLRDRIAIILYNSHNDFEETNLSYEIQNEATGGFTEFLKNRVVLPYEGSLEQFRHVIHHELAHAVALQFYFGTGPGAIISGLSRLQLPLWVVEGLAEYESRGGWSTETEEWIRDAVLNNYLPDISRLDAMPYQGGNALFYYIQQRYGKGKVTELYNAIKSTRGVERGFQKALGQDLESFSKKWHKYMREKYWPEIKDYDTPDEFATPLTDHEKSRNFINNAPALSPRGDMVAFLSERGGLFDIYLMSTLDRRIISKLVSGQRSSSVEELKWLRPGISWGTDGRQIVFAAKAGASDVLHFVNVRKGDITETVRFDDLEGVFSPTWSPNGDLVVFVGMFAGQSDLYSYDIKSKELTKLTDDDYSDLEPVFSFDGKKIAFTSDRGDFTEPVNKEPVDLLKHNYSNSDIYVYDIASKSIQRVTTDLSIEKSPAWYHGADSLLYVSDRNGIFNIYLQDLATGEHRHLTNLLSGANQLSVASETKRLAFTSFYKGGYDIYLWKNPMQNLEIPDTLKVTEFIKDEAPYDSTRVAEEEVAVAEDSQSSRPYRHYVFGKDFAEGRFQTSGDSSVALSREQFRTATGGFKKRKYTPEFSVDWAGAVGGYNTFFGVQGATQVVISDLLSNHQFVIQANIIRSIANSDLSVAYANLSRRWDYSIAAYHFANFFQGTRTVSFGSGQVGRLTTIERFRNYGIGGSLSYPFSRFRRVDFGLNWFNVHQDELLYGEAFGFDSQTVSTMLFTLGYNHDNAVWAYTGPFFGDRVNFGVTFSPKFGKNGIGFTTMTGDLRRYIMLGREYSLALRLSGGASVGQNPTRFLLGGVTNWINYKFARDIDFDLVRDYYFSQFISPLRGADYYQMIGNRYFITNIELKFPLIQYFITRFPLPLGFQNVRGAVFTDIGSAWTGNNFRAFSTNDKGDRVLEDILAGFGWGLRTPFLIGLLRIDQAWSTDLSQVSKPKWYVSFGIDF